MNLKKISKQLHSDDRIKIFLSLNSSDYDSLGEYIKRILEEKYDVWMFKYDGDARYWDVIEQGIEQCRYFMPVISSPALVKLMRLKNINDIKRDKDSGLLYEWKLAYENMMSKKYLETNAVYAIPIICSDVDEKEFKEEIENKQTDLGKNIFWQLFYNGTENVRMDVFKEQGIKAFDRHFNSKQK